MRKLPEHFTRFVDKYPEVGEAHRRLGAAASQAGPLDAKTTALVKLGVAIGAGGEGAGHSAARKALDAGCSADELRHVAILSVTTLGFPAMMRGLAWVEDVLEDTE